MNKFVRVEKQKSENLRRQFRKAVEEKYGSLRAAAIKAGIKPQVLYQYVAYDGHVNPGSLGKLMELLKITM